MGAEKQKFNVGDKVRVVDNRGAPNRYAIGEVCEVESIKHDGYMEIVGKESGMYDYRFELWQPKVGDRVRFTDKCEEYWWFGPNTPHKEGVVTGPASWTGIDGNDYQFDVEVSGEPYPAYVAAEHIEPLPVAAEAQPLRIVEGRYYKTRDGRKAGPAETRDPEEYDAYPWFVPINDDNGHYVFTDEGMYSSDGVEEIHDLIAEWTEEPAAQPPTEAINDKAPSTTGFTIPPVYDEPACEKDGSTQLTVRITSDFTELHEQIDYAFERLKKLKKKARKLGIELDFAKAA
ncbi:hypothetical protein CWR43_27945 [Rhizobium sullae]|uniref:Uncharacterized protein n=1 Tax=Rhizobium sullae TaxID=50338 RepID=A0A2N0D2T7_RHISU|nr:hypothetical protein [Rhizobium sullae]PKA40416.1 hypothetical protein CWR43_27945 [Rhizobium sullae]